MNNSNSSPKVSILVPIYGVEKYIERCARSLFDQTYKNIEYVFVNDHTEDMSMIILTGIIKDYPERKDQILIINHEKNEGLGESRNDGVANATGEFVMHVDSDDYIENNTVEKCVNEYNNTGADIVIFDVCYHFPQYTLKHCRCKTNNCETWGLDLLARNNLASIWGLMIRRSLYVNNDISVSKGVNTSEDYNVTPFLAYYSTKNVHLHDYLYHYDCTNPLSYTYTFSEIKAEQVWLSMAKIESFFKGKGTQYESAINQAKIKILCKNLINTAKDTRYKNYYVKTIQRLKDVDLSNISFIPVFYRICFHIHSYKLLCLYVFVAEKIIRYVKRFSGVQHF